MRLIAFIIALAFVVPAFAQPTAADCKADPKREGCQKK